MNPRMLIPAALLAAAAALQPIAYDDLGGLFRKLGEWRMQTQDCWVDRHWLDAGPTSGSIGPNIATGQPPREYSLLFSSPILEGRVGNGRLRVAIGFAGRAPERRDLPAFGTERDGFALLSIDLDAGLRARLEAGSTVQVYRGRHRLLDLSFDGTAPAFAALDACVATWIYDDSMPNATEAMEADAEPAAEATEQPER